MIDILLTPRLRCVAELVRKNCALADIGTDHAYLPVYLVQTQRIHHAIAADLRPGPLERAQKTIDQYGFAHKIETRLSDGLVHIKPGEAEDIVLAGMGGELIVKILSDCAWVSDPKKHFIFQPMTHSEILRSYLIQNGFAILQQQCVEEGRRVYVLFDAVFIGKRMDYSLAYPYIGELCHLKDPAERHYLEQQIHYLSNRLRGGMDCQLAIILEELKQLYDNGQKSL